MREILFRGKRIDNGEWIEGYFCGGEAAILSYVSHYLFINEDRPACKIYCKNCGVSSKEYVEVDRTLSYVEQVIEAWNMRESERCYDEAHIKVGIDNGLSRYMH